MNKKLKALYISRDFSHRNLKSRIAQKVFFKGTGAYFEEALYSAFSVKEKTIQDFLDSKKPNFDVLVVNSRLKKTSDGLFGEELLIKLAESTNKKKILFICSDRAEKIFSDKALNRYDLIFKRECYKDRSQYDISKKNQDKLHSTMLGCPFFVPVKSRIFLPLKIIFPDIKKNIKKDKEHEVFFAGGITVKNNIRIKTWEKVLDAGFKTYGGLQRDLRRGTNPPEHLLFSNLNRQEYVDAILKTKINLALDGIGEFTFRHLEIWYLGGFMISSPTIRELDLPLPIKEDVHYVSYNDLDEMVEKIRYYLKNDTERDKIARQGKEMFDKYYNPVKHGQKIKNLLKI